VPGAYGLTTSLPTADPSFWRREFAPEDMLLGEQAQLCVLQDFSWYSPLLSAQLADVSVDAIVLLRAIEQLEFAIETPVSVNQAI
jgi:hypothetical protein